MSLRARSCLLFACLAAVTLAGCGNKGPLVKPAAGQALAEPASPAADASALGAPAAR